MPGIRVQGASLLDNGVPWVPRGVQIVGLVAPPPALVGKYIAAGQHFGLAELQAAVAEHADMIRFQVSEFGIDPQGPLYSAAYVQSVQAAIEEARSLGLNVIVSLQAESPAGELTRCPLPDAGAERAWAVLAPMFAGDNGVMFELYNEPGILNTRLNWQTWLNGGQVISGGVTCQAVGMQTLVNDIRADGADNVIVLPGLNTETTLAGVPKVNDPASPDDPQFAYSVHYPLMTAPPTNVGCGVRQPERDEAGDPDRMERELHHELHPVVAPTLASAAHLSGRQTDRNRRVRDGSARHADHRLQLYADHLQCFHLWRIRRWPRSAAVQ